MRCNGRTMKFFAWNCSKRRAKIDESKVAIWRTFFQCVVLKICDIDTSLPNSYVMWNKPFLWRRTKYVFPDSVFVQALYSLGIFSALRVYCIILLRRGRKKWSLFTYPRHDISELGFVAIWWFHSVGTELQHSVGNKCVVAIQGKRPSENCCHGIHEGWFCPLFLNWKIVNLWYQNDSIWAHNPEMVIVYVYHSFTHCLDGKINYHLPIWSKA